MFKGFINWFKGEQKPGAITQGETDMTAKIVKTSDGKFALRTFGRGTVGTYTRRRDAVRGANRRGLTVV